MDIVDGIVSWWANQYGFEIQEVKQLDDDTLYFRVRALGARERASLLRYGRSPPQIPSATPVKAPDGDLPVKPAITL